MRPADGGVDSTDLQLTMLDIQLDRKTKRVAHGQPHILIPRQAHRHFIVGMNLHGQDEFFSSTRPNHLPLASRDSYEDPPPPLETDERSGGNFVRTGAEGSRVAQ